MTRSRQSRPRLCPCLPCHPHCPPPPASLSAMARGEVSPSQACGRRGREESGRERVTCQRVVFFLARSLGRGDLFRKKIRGRNINHESAWFLRGLPILRNRTSETRTNVSIERAAVEVRFHLHQPPSVSIYTTRRGADLCVCRRNEERSRVYKYELINKKEKRQLQGPLRAGALREGRTSTFSLRVLTLR